MLKLFLFFFHTNNLFLTEIIKLAKGENDNQTQLAKMTLCELDGYEMQVRSANIGKLKKNYSMCPYNQGWTQGSLKSPIQNAYHILSRDSMVLFGHIEFLRPAVNQILKIALPF
jgi:hypothetical protein